MSRDPRARLRVLGTRDYRLTWDEMRAFTAARTPACADEFWLVEHPPVFTLGQAGREEHVLAPGGIPLVRSDRGGQVTYHGPGQLVLYTLVDMRRLGIGVRGMVEQLEQAVIDLLAAHGIVALRRGGAPGVYVDDAKIAALGLRVRNARSYHGVALNVDMDLAPFSRINPCGYRGLRVTSLRELGVATTVREVGEDLAHRLAAGLGIELDEAAQRDAVDVSRVAAP